MKLKLLLIGLGLSAPLAASEMVYTPINPSFGGSPLNGSFLLSKAQSQNAHSESRDELTYGERFEDSLQRAYINKLVREINDYAFGEMDEDNPLLNGDQSFVTGDYTIEVITSNSDAVTVKVINSVTGEISIIEIPRI